LSGSDIPTWLPSRIFVEAEVVSQITLLRRKPIATAHSELD
jgi:hypothetical protein